jgi:hypothetical protein
MTLADVGPSLRSLAEADAHGGWTPERVQARLIEAYDVLRRLPGRLGPKAHGNAWPEFRSVAVYDEHELRDLLALDRMAYRAAVAENEEVRQARVADQRAKADKPKAPEADEVSRAQEALGWALSHLRDAPLQADALGLWCLCTASCGNLEAILRQRRQIADDLVEDRRKEIRAEEKRDRAIMAELRKRTQRVDPLVERRQAAETEAMAALRQEVIAKAIAWANERLAGVLEPERAEAIKENARIKAERDLAAAKPERVTRQMVWPGKNFTRRALDKHRKAGAAALAKALDREGIEVR